MDILVAGGGGGGGAARTDSNVNLAIWTDNSFYAGGYGGGSYGVR